MPVKIKSIGGGSVTFDVPNTGSDYTLTMPAATGSLIASGVANTIDSSMLAANSVTSTQLAASAVTLDKISASTKLVKYTRIVYSTRVSFGVGTSDTYWTTPYTKVRSDSFLLVDVEIAMRTNYSDHLIHQMQYAGSSWFQGTQPYDAGFSANARPYKSSFLLTGITATGSNNIALGWTTNDTQAGNKMAVIWNPTSADDSRLNQEYSCMNVWEMV